MATLYMISTPIGNMGDISIRALETLWSVDLIVCEDTRETQALLNFYKDKFDSPYPRLLSYNDHNREKRIPVIIEELKKGSDIAFVSDRGTPLVSDPGYKLVRAIQALGDEQKSITVDVIPGANAALTALIYSGFPPDTFYFAGFLPRKKHKQEQALKDLPRVTVVLYESPKRVCDVLAVMSDVLGDKSVTVCIDLTKKYQRIVRGRISEVVPQLETKQLRGEVTVVLDNKEP